MLFKKIFFLILTISSFSMQHAKTQDIAVCDGIDLGKIKIHDHEDFQTIDEKNLIDHNLLTDLESGRIGFEIRFLESSLGRTKVCILSCNGDSFNIKRLTTIKTDAENYRKTLRNSMYKMLSTGANSDEIILVKDEDLTANLPIVKRSQFIKELNSNHFTSMPSTIRHAKFIETKLKQNLSKFGSDYLMFKIRIGTKIHYSYFEKVGGHLGLSKNDYQYLTRIEQIFNQYNLL